MSDFWPKLLDAIIAWFPIIFGCGVLAAFGWVIIQGVGQLRRERRARLIRRALQARAVYSVTARIADKILPMERGAKYAKPLENALANRGIGLVSGGGTQMANDGSVEWVDLQIDLINLEDALEFTRKFLQGLGVPAGSVLIYSNETQRVTLPIV